MQRRNRTERKYSARSSPACSASRDVRKGARRDGDCWCRRKISRLTADRPARKHFSRCRRDVTIPSVLSALGHARTPLTCAGGGETTPPLRPFVYQCARRPQTVKGSCSEERRCTLRYQSGQLCTDNGILFARCPTTAPSLFFHKVSLVVLALGHGGASCTDFWMGSLVFAPAWHTGAVCCCLTTPWHPTLWQMNEVSVRPNTTSRCSTSRA